MNVKTATAALIAALAATAALAAPKVRRAAGGDDMVTQGRGAKILIVQEPRLGQAACLSAPAVQGGSTVGQCYKKPRKWIVLETKYDTFGTETSKFLDQLTFTWHVLLDTKNATENKGNKEGLAPYSYFTTATTYVNIPAGSHAASVVLPPSCLERFGDPRAVGLEISNQNGEMLAGDCWSEVKGIAPHTKFWEDQKIMGAVTKEGTPMIERRQGLLDRSKTIWALVFPNDFEQVAQ